MLLDSVTSILFTWAGLPQPRSHSAFPTTLTLPPSIPPDYSSNSGHTFCHSPQLQPHSQPILILASTPFWENFTKIFSAPCSQAHFLDFLLHWTAGFHVQLVDSENTDGYFLLFFYILPNPLPPEARTVLHRTGTQKLGQSTQRPLVTLSTINICFAHQGLQPWWCPFLSTLQLLGLH